MSASACLSKFAIPRKPLTTLLPHFCLSLHWGRADPMALYTVEGGINDVIGSNHASSFELGVSITHALSDRGPVE